MMREYTTQQIHALPSGKLRPEQTNVVNVTSDHRITTLGAPMQFVTIAALVGFLPGAYRVFYNAPSNANR